MPLRSNFGRREAAPRVALSERSRLSHGACLGAAPSGPQRAREGGPPSPMGRLGHSGAAGTPT
eukprot:11871322-Alexandrium_andersonii.AAC.1